MQRPRIFPLLPKLFRYDDDVNEATGLTIDAYAKATMFMASVFFGPALLQLGKDIVAIKCEGNLDDEVDCETNTRVYGFKPTSVLTNIAVFAGLIASFLLPILGAIVDHTSYRKQLGMFSAMALTLIKVAEIGVSIRTWFPIVCIQTLSIICYHVHNVSVCKCRLKALIT
jgi:MFS transporter, UMF1 family